MYVLYEVLSRRCKYASMHCELSFRSMRTRDVGYTVYTIFLHVRAVEIEGECSSCTHYSLEHTVIKNDAKRTG